MLENQTVETLEKTLPKVLTNEEVHLQKFNEYLFVTVVITQAVSDRLIKVILNNKEDDIKSKERFRVKQRNFKLISENNSHKLGQEVKIKEHSIETKKVLPVLVFRHSDNGLEFKNALVSNLVNTWSGTCKIVHGKPRCPWVQGKVEQSNGYLQKILASIMEERNNDTWSDFLPEVQYMMNTNQHSVSRSTPYKMVTGVMHNLGMEGAIDGGDEDETVVNAVTTDSEVAVIADSEVAVIADNEVAVIADNEVAVIADNEVAVIAASQSQVQVAGTSAQVDGSKKRKKKTKSTTSSVNSSFEGDENDQDESDEDESSEDESDESAVDTRNLDAIRAKLSKSRERMSTKHNNKRNKKTHDFATGDFVAVIVPREDRGHSDLRRLPGQIIQKFPGKIPQYTISTAFGVLQDKYGVRFLSPYEGVVDVDNSKKISLHQAASRASRHTVDAAIVQISCECKTGCKTKSCACKKLNKPCTSHCHLKLFKKQVCVNRTA